MPILECTDPVDSCGYRIRHPDCSIDTNDIGLGPGRRHIIQTKWISEADTGRPLPEVWLFIDGYKPYKLSDFEDGQTYSLNWDMRKSLTEGTIKIGLFFPPTDAEKVQWINGYWIFSDGPTAHITYHDEHIDIQFDYGYGVPANNPYDESIPTQDPLAPCSGITRSIGLCLYDCCPDDCTKPYDNTVFCWETHNESPFALSAMTDPGLAKQVFISQEAGVQPLRGIATTRSADAFDQDLRLLYSSQKWVMVWDFEINRLIDFFPAEWLRFGAAAYYQNQTLRKEIKPGFSNRHPYYLEIVDLGLVNGPQGAYKLDLDVDGQRSTNWDVPSRIIGLHREGQQLPPEAWGMPKPVTARTLYTEFNQVSVDAFRQVSQDAVPALRERFFKDRDLFLDHTTRQRFHDQIMFLTKETAARTLRLFQDMIDNGRQLVDTFNPQTNASFGYYTIALLSVVSQKILRAKQDNKIPNPTGFALEPDEETNADWLRYVYGELRRLVEIAKIEKKDFQTTMLEALKEVDPANPNSFLTLLQSKIDPALLKQQYDMAANGRVNPGNGLVDPDTKDENKIRGIPTTTKSVKL